MAILSSRNVACVNPLIKDLPNKNEACAELLRDASIGVVSMIVYCSIINFHTTFAS